MAHPNGALYVRVGSDLELIEQLQIEAAAAGQRPPDYDPTRGPFARIGCYRKSDNTPTWLDDMHQLEQLAARFGEVIAYYDTDADALWCFHLREDGTRRALSYCDQEWTAEGEPDPWEAAWLFGAGTLEHALEQLRDEFDGSKFEREAAEVRACWDAKVIAAGARYPSIDPSQLINGLCKHYGLSAAY